MLANQLISQSEERFYLLRLFRLPVDTAKNHGNLLSRCRKMKANLTQKIFIPMHIRLMKIFSLLSD